jgi:hypothetical protein
MTLVASLKKREQENREEILRLLNYTNDEMSFFIFEGAYEYLEVIFGTDAYGMTHIPKTCEFWAWWQKKWAEIDAVFVHAVSRRGNKIQFWEVRHRDHEWRQVLCQNVEELRAQYFRYHEASMNNVYINSDVTRASMHTMMNEIILNQKRALDESRK